ncbi:terpene cyclase [Diplogelasinospora grovesii]|uniref:Terpene cyclase n=1 Tax=Diplogelasinospora grovesii TaxID=303347 RepID=A0AAN6S9X9_9PEZI|nr:terpene cyclase [Diplogelasinospora grovesii]
MGSIEATAYGVLILCEARNMCFFNNLRRELDDAIHRGATFLNTAAPGSASAEHLWIEKVSYTSTAVTEAYVLAAQKAASSPVGHVSIGTPFQMDVHMAPAKMAGYVQLFRQTPLFSSVPKWQVWLSVFEASLFMPLLRARRLEVFPRKGMEKDKYFEIIPFTWTSCNNRSRTFASTSFLYDMMVISFLNYQADEFMEAVAGPAFLGNLSGLRRLIDGLFSAEDTAEAVTVNDTNDRDGSDSDSGVSMNGKESASENVAEIDMATQDAKQEEDVGIPLRRFVSHVLSHPSILNASSWDRATLRRELRIFLLAHVSQIEDNDRFGRDQDNAKIDRDVFSSATTSFFQWVRTTSADHTSCPYSFAFVSSLLSASVAGGADCFPSAREKYLAEAACRHLATMCRMYNDYGSLARDRAERNLNSINFPEFSRGGASNVDGADDEAKKAALFAVAEYERSCLDLALDRLEKEP